MSRAAGSVVRFVARGVLGLAQGSETPVAYVARRWSLRRLLCSCGAGVHVGSGLHIVGPGAVAVGDRFRTMRGVMLYASGVGEITIGADCSINANVQIDAGPRDRIRVGDDVLIGPNVVLRNCDHHWREESRLIREQGHVCADIEIGNNVWIAANSVVLGGVKLGDGCVVAAGSVVRRGTYGPDVLLGGNPATVIGGRTRESDSYGGGDSNDDSHQGTTTPA